ncbi:hypothetical protein BDK51DRAFT_46384 [Blyttiomyces helicus]|uniref:C2H2-type domain-containing protein n=1 Tax=Blyttiomyces helicus TaxID=388810 RepID=A0A4P9W805_9FUNG|nr:hypothetical protein BDK51DRAFT_46384 [Blyttiomyces helicus]|eukprot:RKO88631.1 hypothetical protein BDK51DRAFT_46384 [Blyttiomyces helicus]
MPFSPLRVAGANFRRKHDLMRHVRSQHIADKPHHCEECGRIYARADGVCGVYASSLGGGGRRDAFDKWRSNIHQQDGIFFSSLQLRRHQEGHHITGTDARRCVQSTSPAAEEPSTPTVGYKPQLNNPPVEATATSPAQPPASLAFPPLSEHVPLPSSFLEWATPSDPVWPERDPALCSLVTAQTTELTPGSPTPSWSQVSLSPESLPESLPPVEWAAACGAFCSGMEAAPWLGWWEEKTVWEVVKIEL